MELYFVSRTLELCVLFHLQTRRIVTFQVTIIFGLGFMSFCGGHFEFGWVIFIMTD